MILSDGTSLNSAEKEESGKNAILVTNWSTIVLNKTANGNTCIIGQGAFGIVVRGLWMHNGRGTDVAIKVVTRSLALASRCKYSDEYDRIRNEAELIYRAQKLMLFRENIIQVYGLVSGVLPEALTSAFGISKGEDALGMIMRFEEGGSLDKLLYPPPGIIQTPLKMVEKLNILLDIANALYELHSIKIIHGDIKSQNVLLGAGRVARLADFGLSAIRSAVTDSSIGSSILSETSTASIGTPVYCAPEMLVCGDDNELDGEDSQRLHARSSRSTDMYSFGILTWEVLCNEKPWSKIRSEIALARRVCGGDRPSLDLLPRDTPPTVRAMMEACWSGDRTKRLSASQCHSILQHAICIKNSNFDIFFSQATTNTAVLCQLHKMLSRLGFRVVYDQEILSIEQFKDRIEKSKVVLICFDKAYQSDRFCKLELSELYTNYPHKPIVVLGMEPGFHTWATDEFSRMCKLDTHMYVDLSDFYGMKSDQIDSNTCLLKLANSAQKLLSIFSKLRITPSDSATDTEESTTPTFSVALNDLPDNAAYELRAAARRGDLVTLSTICSKLTKTTVLDEADEDENTALSWAAQKGHLECIQKLIESGVSVDKASMNGSTPLYFAVAYGHTECAEALIKDGEANINLAKYNGATPAYCAAERGCHDCLKLLIDAGADVNLIEKVDGNTPLLIACKNGHYCCAELLLIAKASILLPNKYGQSPEDVSPQVRIKVLLRRYLRGFGEGQRQPWDSNTFIWINACFSPADYGYNYDDVGIRSVLTCFCPAFVIYLMMLSIDAKRAPHVAFQYCALSCCCIAGPCVGFPFRRQHRINWLIDESYPCEDLFLSTCCYGCSLIQLWHQLRWSHYEFDDQDQQKYY